MASPALAEWSATGGGALFYTDNANLFSATRRSSLDGDPSQPVLDTSAFGHGKDMVFEPNLRVMKFFLGSGRLLYQVTDNTAVTFTVQRANRTLNSEQEHIQAFNTNVGLGALYRF